MNQKKKFALFAVTFLVLSLLSGLWFFKPTQTIAESTQAEPAVGRATSEKRMVTVSAQGQVTVDADQCQVRLSVVEANPEALEASNAVNETMAIIFSTLEELGIEKSDMETVNFSLEPRYNWDHSPATIEGYEARNSILITIHDLDKVEEAVSRALDAGANSVEQIQYQLKDESAVYKEALKKAVTSAREKAQVIAEASGVQLEDAPYVIGEKSDTTTYSIMNSVLEAKASAMPMDMGSAAGPTVSLAEQKIVVTAYVDAAYGIR